MNEAMLTGESIPVVKQALPSTGDIFNFKNDIKYAILGGTKVIQTRKMGSDKVLGLVIKSGFMTSKGSLVRDILYPKPTKFKFFRDSSIFLAFMAGYAFLGYFIVIKSLLDAGTETETMVTNGLDMLTLAIPPVLPSCMTVGALYAVSRLKTSKIFSISP